MVASDGQIRVGSLFSGYGGLDLAIENITGGRTVWVSDINEDANTILAHRFPNIPNIGDVAEVAWDSVEPVDVLCGGFPCFTAGHTVLTKRGLVPIEEILVGDSVLTHRNRWRQVTATAEKTADVVRVAGFGHTSIIATADHPFLTREGDWVAAEKMTGRFWGTPYKIPSLPAPAELGTVEDAFLLGLYLRCGHVDTGNGGKSVILSMLGSKAASAVGRLQGQWTVTETLNHGQQVTRLTITRAKLAPLVESEFGSGADSKTIPAWVFGMPEDWRDALLEGLRFADGHDFGSGWKLASVNRQLAVGVRLLAAMKPNLAHSIYFDESFRVTVVEGRTVNQRDLWTVAVQEPSHPWEETWDGTHRWRRVRSVGNAGRARVFDITVDEDHSFICDGIVVHNCQDLSTAGKRAGLRPGTRSGLWEHMAYSINALQPKMVVIENVRGIFSASAHSSVDSRVVPASPATVAAVAESAATTSTDPNVFYRPSSETETSPDAARAARRTEEPKHLCPPGEPATKLGERSRSSSHTDSVRCEGRESGAENDVGCDEKGSVQGGEPEPSVRVGDDTRMADERKVPQRGVAAEGKFVSGTSTTNFGPYAPVLQQWENILGRPVPEPTVPGGTGGRERLNPRFVEFMMGLPEGWVTDVPIGRNAHLKALGNGVVPQQAQLALTILLGHAADQ